MMSVLWRVFPWVFFVGGLIASGVLYKDHREQVLLKEQGLQTTGKVEWTSLYSKSCSSSIRVTFVDRNAKPFTKYFNVCSRQYRPGETVDVIYLPANPEVASLSAREAITPGTQKTVGMVVAALLALIGAALLFALRRKNARRSESADP
jgi:LPXTG-motif cell wall-anchored protein